MSLFKMSGAPSPPRRLLIQPSATSPFCTSPSQLQEVTLDPDATNFSYFGMRSPGAITNCRSVKEIDEQLTNLRKENFNLKLRIYFLEERMGANYNTDKEDAIKKNIELMVELENVRKELEDKQELLCQAAKAMEIEEEERKKEVMERDQEIADLKEALEEVRGQLDSEAYLREEKKELALCAQAFNLDLNECKTTDIVKKLQSTITDLQTQLKKERDRADHFESVIELAENAHVRCNHLESEVRERECKINNFTSELEQSNRTMTSYSQRVSLLEEELKQKTGQLQDALAELRQKDRDLKEHTNEIKELNQLYESAEQQKEKHERKAEKYKAMLIQCENKNHDMLSYIDNLRSTIHTLEMRLETAVDEVKKTNKKKTETVLMTDQKLKSSYTDVDLFSVRTPFPVPETPKSSKISPKINRSPKSIHSKNSSVNSTSSAKSKNNSGSQSREISEIISYQSTPNKKNSAISENPSEEPLSNEELLELKKNHYKACKMIKAMIQRKNEYIDQIAKLETLVAERSSEIQVLQEKVEELTECNNTFSVKQKKKSLQELVSDMHLTATSNPAATNKETSMAEGEMHLAEQYKELANELEKKIEVLNATLNEKDDQLEQLKIEMLSKANRIIDLEFELLTLNQGVNKTLDSSSDREDAVEKLLQDQKQKDKEIKRLDSELRKRTCDLQGIVNKELWEKNRSIEKLQIVLKARDEEINKLEKNVYGKEQQLKILKDKINELGVHVNLPPGLIVSESLNGSSGDMNAIHEQLKVCIDERKLFLQKIEDLQVKLKNIPEHDDENRQLLQLKREYKDLREELDKSEKLRQESQEICSVLSNRLEELCYFLDSLLKHKSVLGFLGNEQVYKLQTIVDKSFNLSRTLSSTMSLNLDQSLLQLSNITSLLNSTRNDSLNLNFNDFVVPDEENNAVLSIIPSDVTLTYQSHLNRTCSGLNEQAEVITVLRQQIANLKREIELRDVELGKRLIHVEEGEKPLENDEEFVDALVDLQPQVSLPVIDLSEPVLENLAHNTSKLNATSSTLIAEKSIVNTTSTTLKNCTNENQSESESWSEPDRTVSMARIGLQDDSLKRPSNTSLNRRTRFAAGSNISTESTEDDLSACSTRTPSKRGTLTESRQTIISLHEQVCDLELKLKEKENQVLAAQVAFYETDNLLKQEQAKVEESLRTNLQLSMQIMDTNKKLSIVEQQKHDAERQRHEVEQKMIEIGEEHSQLVAQIKETNEKFNEAEKRKCSAEEKILELQQIIATLEEFRRNVEATMDMKNKETQNTINHMEVEKSKAMLAAQNAEKLLERAKIDVQVAEAQLQNMHKREQELEEKYNDNLKKAEEQYADNVKTIERNYEAQARKCREAVVQIQESYEKDYIKKSEVDQRIIEIEEITKEMASLKAIIQDCETKMHGMDEREIELKNKTQDLQREHHDKIYDLHKQLDTATLQYSEVILEKSRLKNETAVLEQKVQKFYAKEVELIQEVSNLHKEFQEAQTILQMQVSQLEHQKSVLEVKVSNLEAVNAELQSSNAELRNRLVKIQIGKNIGEVVSSTSLPNNPSNILGLHPNRTLPITIQSGAQYFRQLSDHSGYTSEDTPADESGLKSISDFAHLHVHNLLREMDNERVQANSSPDLGIESDHGRFSSLEANVNIPRPLLPTLELTESMSNLLDPVQDVSCINDQCCKKTKQMANENVELRKRLLRTRRALEETLNRLTLANKQKKEVEKSICKQIHKTSQVLRRAKANLDSGSETDILNK